MQSSDIAWEVSRCSIRRNFICKKSQCKGDNSVCHWYRHSWKVSRCSTRRNFICKKSQGKGDNLVCHW